MQDKRFQQTDHDDVSAVLFRAHPQPMWVFDRASLAFLAVNDAAIRRYGYSEAEFLSMTLRDIRPKEDIPALEALLTTRRKAVHNAGIWRHRTRSGEIIYAEIHASPLAFEGRDAELVMINDVTARRGAEDGLHKVMLAVQQSFIAVVLTDPAGHIEFANPAFCDSSGYPVSELIGIPIHELNPETGLEQAIVERSVWSGEVLSRRKGGMNYWEHVALSPIVSQRSGEGIAGFVCIRKDITERKRFVELLIQHETALRELNQSLVDVRENERRRLARELHDDIGQLAAAVNIDLHWVLNRTQGNDDALARRVRHTTDHMTYIISAIRRISEDLRPGMLDNLGLAAAIEQHAERFSERSGVRCSVHVDPQEMTLPEPLAINLFRIVQEALNNVERHAGASQVVIELNDMGDRVRLSVRDDGRGLAPLPEDDSRPRHGLLGMRERVNMLGGQMLIESLPGAGVSIEIVLASTLTEEVE